MRPAALTFLLALTACGSNSHPDPATLLGAGSPGLDVARAALAGGSPHSALALSGAALQRDPGNLKAMLTQADAAAELGRLAEAEALYEQARQIDPSSEAALLGLGRIRLTTDPAIAEILFLEVSTHNPRNAAALNNLGIARDLQGRHAAAQAAYRQALGVAPEMRAATVNLALSLALSGRAGQGLDLVRPLRISREAATRFRHDFAAIAEMAGDRKSAELAIKPDLPPEQVRTALGGYDALSRPGAELDAPDRSTGR
ncbi:MAG: tetratricopeptide repeat protein [Acetobacteraceae bacterium]|nr:tetratricopeptide repeat protein [Acetobacteraceae bacterium]